MRQVETGKGLIPVMSMWAIWSLSLGINLPGLAVAPMLGHLHDILGNVSELEVQLLTMMPNIMIVPMLIIGGRLSMTSHKYQTIGAALLTYATAGFLYLFCRSMTALILVSALLGIGCGLLIPFSTGLVADVFAGTYRIRQMGIVSAIGNLALVIATLIVGALASVNWHLPFLVYLLPVVSLAMMPWLKRLPATDLPSASSTAASSGGGAADPAKVGRDILFHGFFVRRTLGLIAVYFFYVVCFSAVSYYIPFLMDHCHMSTTLVGVTTATLCLMVFVSGMLLPRWIRLFHVHTFTMGAVAVTLGFVALSVSEALPLMLVGAMLVGLGIGVIQPVVFDKAPETVNTPLKASLALGVVMVGNYVGIALCPVIVEFLSRIFGCEGNVRFPFWAVGAAALIVTTWGVIKYRSFPFNMGDHPAVLAMKERSKVNNL